MIKEVVQQETLIDSRAVYLNYIIPFDFKDAKTWIKQVKADTAKDNLIQFIFERHIFPEDEMIAVSF